jgi:hypothetical protein
MPRSVPIRFTAVCEVLLGLVLAGCSDAGRTLLQPDEIPAAADVIAASPQTQLVTGLQGGAGTTIGPGGARFVTGGREAGFRASIRRPARSRRSPVACRPRSSASAG